MALVQIPKSASALSKKPFVPGQVDEYFQGHRSYSYTPSADISVLKEFKRLAIDQKWDEKRREKEKKAFYVAVDAEFTARVGKGNSLIEWQRLAKVIGIDPLPQTITQCRKVTKISLHSSTLARSEMLLTLYGNTYR